MKTLRDINIDNKTVIVRFDYNVPIKNGIIIDDTRIKKSLKTLNYILEKASHVVILSHLGRINTKEDLKNNSLKPVCDYLSNLINENIKFCIYENEYELINSNKIVMMENTRLFDIDNKRESNCDEELSKYFSSFGDVFVNDAFGVSHRKNASNVGISKYLESCVGFLIEEEINNLNKIINPSRPFIVIMGGSKVSDKIGIINNLIKKVDKLLIGGGMAYTFLKAKGYEIGKSVCEDDYLDYAREVLKSGKIILPVDSYIENMEIKNIEDILKEDKCLDIGPRTVSLFEKELINSKTVFFNGPLGRFEDGYSYGTKKIFEYLNKINGIVIVGGGDTVSSVNKLLNKNNFIISTGGGAALEYLEGKELPGVVYEEEKF